MTERIPQNWWRSYFEDLSLQCQGWSITMEVLRMDLGDQVALEKAPLQGVSFETEGTDAGDILIETGELALGYDIHPVEGPRSVWVMLAPDDGEADICIESEDGTRTLLCLRPRLALPPATESIS